VSVVGEQFGFAPQNHRSPQLIKTNKLCGGDDVMLLNLVPLHYIVVANKIIRGILMSIGVLGNRRRISMFG